MRVWVQCCLHVWLMHGWDRDVQASSQAYVLAACTPVSAASAGLGHSFLPLTEYLPVLSFHCSFKTCVSPAPVTLFSHTDQAAGAEVLQGEQGGQTAIRGVWQWMGKRRHDQKGGRWKGWNYGAGFHLGERG